MSYLHLVCLQTIVLREKATLRALQEQWGNNEVLPLPNNVKDALDSSSINLYELEEYLYSLPEFVKRELLDLLETGSHKFYEWLEVHDTNVTTTTKSVIPVMCTWDRDRQTRIDYLATAYHKHPRVYPSILLGGLRTMEPCPFLLGFIFQALLLKFEQLYKLIDCQYIHHEKLLELPLWKNDGLQFNYHEVNVALEEFEASHGPNEWVSDLRCAFLNDIHDNTPKLSPSLKNMDAPTLRFLNAAMCSPCEVKPTQNLVQQIIRRTYPNPFLKNIIELMQQGFSIQDMQTYGEAFFR